MLKTNGLQQVRNQDVNLEYKLNVNTINDLQLQTITIEKSQQPPTIRNRTVTIAIN